MNLYQTIKQEIKNTIGDLFGEARCCVTGNTLRKEFCCSVPVSDSLLVAVSAKALEVATREEIATCVLERISDAENHYSPEKVAASIPDKCIFHYRGEP